jgi:ferredoxin-NADP reductase
MRDHNYLFLIIGGIGVTPFASILQSLVIKYKKTLKKCPTCAHEWYDSFEQKKLKKVVKLNNF